MIQESPILVQKLHTEEFLFIISENESENEKYEVQITWNVCIYIFFNQLIKKIVDS